MSKSIKCIFIIVGLLMIVGSIWTYKSRQAFLEVALSAEGTVTDLIRKYDPSDDMETFAPLVEFQTDNGLLIEFKSSVSSNPPSYSRGDRVEVMYEASNPEKAKINSFFSLWGASLISGVFGVVFFLFGFLQVLYGFFNGNKIDRLTETGIPVNAKLQGVELNSSYRVNGKSPYQIFAEWTNPATSKLHIFKSENIWFNPESHIEGDDITVLIDKDNPKKYHLDTSFLPEIA